MRVIAGEIDPTLRVNNVVPLSRVNDGEAQANWMLTSIAWSVSLMTLLLSAVGIMLTAGLVACAAPLRRALRVDPTEALRREG